MNTLLAILLSVSITANIDSTTLKIGDQTNLHITAQTTDGEKVEFPVLGDEWQKGVEIVSQTEVKTSKKKNLTLYERDYTITSFLDSLFLLNEQPFVVKNSQGEPTGDTAYSNTLTLNVIQPFAIDTTNAITDIKPVVNMPTPWLKWTLWALLLVLTIVVGSWGVYYLVKFLKIHQSKGVDLPVKNEPQRPCEEVALEKLDAIKEQKVWQQGEEKRYYSDLTDVLREYIAGRYEVSSQQQTSGEIVAGLEKKMQGEQKNLWQQLRQMLQLADLVKFAKWRSTPDENEQMLDFSYSFVKETTPAKEPETNNVQENTQPIENENLNTKSKNA